MIRKLAVCGLAAAALTSLSTSADAFGGCGRNGHRNAWGACVYGARTRATAPLSAEPRSECGTGTFAAFVEGGSNTRSRLAAAG